jgi:RimJ/RimL family protein N-acetyltransferase
MMNHDLPALKEIVCDEHTMYAFDGAWSDEKNRDAFQNQINSYRKNGFGRWAVVLKETSQVIGICGLIWLDADIGRVPEIGYMFNRAFWHKGYATEAAISCIKYAFDKLGFDEVFSIIRDSNFAAMNVAIKSGMFVRGRHKYEGDSYYCYNFSVKR